MNGMTERQREVFDFLVLYVKENGYPPTIREIREAFRLKSNRGVVDHLRALERKGYIRRNRKRSRAIEILNSPGEAGRTSAAGTETMSYPIAGGITAGKPAEALEEIEDVVILDRGLFRESGDFILKVEGDSMIDDHIIPGDLLIVKRAHQCENGDIVVALIDGEATVKRFRRKGKKVLLQPANPRYEPIEFGAGNERNCSIVGRVIGVIRRLSGSGRSFSG